MGSSGAPRHSVREFIEEAFRYLGSEIEWRGDGVDEIGIDQAAGKVAIRIDPRYFRLAEVDLLVGDCSKAKAKLGWEPAVKFAELVRIMMEADLQLVGGKDKDDDGFTQGREDLRGRAYGPSGIVGSAQTAGARP